MNRNFDIDRIFTFARVFVQQGSDDEPGMMILAVDELFQAIEEKSDVDFLLRMVRQPLLPCIVSQLNGQINQQPRVL